MPRERRAPPPAPAARGPGLLLAAVAALCLAISVTFPIYDPDLWQHLAVGRVVWETHRLPHTQIWSWPTYGAPDVMHSWAFRTLLYPFWNAGGVTGIFVWRWLTTLAAFALLWRVARALGARGVMPVVVLVIAGLVWRQRSMARPETLAAILLALELWILEARRNRGDARNEVPTAPRDHSLWLIAVLGVWVQVHVSFVFGFFVLAVYAAHDLVARHPAPASPGASGSRARLALLLGASTAVAFLNPYGAGLVLQPFEFFLHQRHEPLLRSIDELRPPLWSENLLNGLPLFAIGWPLLAVARALRGRADVVELVLCAAFTAAGLSSQRFIGFQALVAAPFLARDLEALFVARDAGARHAGAPGWPRAAAAAAVCVLACIPEWTRPAPRPGFGLDLREFPVAACDFMEAHGVRGKGFNYFYDGGYLLWRFHAERDRLPFMDIHQAGTPAIRAEYHAAFASRAAWRALEEEHHFDWLLLRRRPAAGDSILDFADADTLYRCVFLDDAAALYVRRAGALGAVADSFGYRILPASAGPLGALGRAVEQDTALRAATRRELERARAGSPRHARAASLLANVEMIEGHFAAARALLLEAQAIAPETPLVARRLELIARRDSSSEEHGRTPPDSTRGAVP